jgi:hypothetical protein
LALSLAYLSYLAAEQGDPRRAWELLDQAGRHVRSREHAVARAWVSARQAEEAATLGEGAALVLLDRAMTVMDYAEPERGRAWTRFFDNARLGALAVSTYGRLGHPDLAPAADAVLAEVRDAKTQAVILGDVATAHVRNGDLDQGCEVAGRALEVTMRTQATLGRQRLKALTPALASAGTPTSRDLAERIAAAV